MRSFHFRKMEEKDLPFFLRVRNSSSEFLHCNTEFTLEEATRWFKTLPEHKWYLVVNCDGGDIGYFRLEYVLPMGTKIKLIVGADLAEEHRGKGLAYEMYLELFKQTKGVSRYLLEVLGSNTRAYSLYRKLGFEVYKVTDLIRDGRPIPSLHMVKYVT